MKNAFHVGSPPRLIAPELLQHAFARADAFEARAQWEEAYGELHEAIRIATRCADSLSVLLGFLSVARVLRKGGREEAAEDVIHLAISMSELQNRPCEKARALNMLGMIRHQHEQWGEARALYSEALEIARDEGDDAMIASTCPNLGVIANATGDLREARVLYLEGIGACVRSGNARITGNTYNNLGMACSDMGEWMEAEIHFIRGVEIAERIDDRGLLARLLTGRAEPLIRTSNFSEAERSLDRAEEIARELKDARSSSDIERFRGMMWRARGEHDRAETHLERALAIAAAAGLTLEQAETLEQVVHLRVAQRRLAAARVTLRESRRLYETLGARRDLERLDALAADLQSDHSSAEQPTSPA